MKIMICASMRYAQEILKTKQKLERMGLTVFVPHDIDSHIEDPGLVDNLDKNLIHAQEADIMRACFNLIAQADAILVLNFDRNGIPGYIGTSALMEIGIAHYLKKQIYLYNPLPSYHDARWAHEISIMNPMVIHGNLSKITE
ncbi:MAG: hypothetical protein ACM3IJ_01705 [Candidatus Levyibacteriota bacterium]